MNDIENDHAKPALIPLITGEIDISITRSMARSIAIYAFKTAVVQNHADHKSAPFFPRHLRHAFRTHSSIPPNVRIWICGIKRTLPAVQVMTAYYSAQLSPANRSLMYAFTCEIGHFVMQVVAVKQSGQTGFRPLGGFEYIGIPIWPDIDLRQTWPGHYVLDGDVGHFEGFAKRWAHVLPFGQGVS